MKCIHCNSNNFRVEKVRFAPDVRGEAMDIIAPCHVCTGCGESMMTDSEMQAFRKLTADTYREKHGLLTSEQIVNYRKALGMTQETFADYLNVGKASIKRWETCFIQDEGQDEHIRLKCDKGYAEWNALHVYFKNRPEDQFNGKRTFRFDLLKNVILYLLEAATTPLFLNKALFYADFLHFKRHGTSITGMVYVPLDYGPCPDQFQPMFHHLETTGCVKRKGKHALAGTVKPNMDLFDDEEKATLKTLYDLLKGDGGKQLFDLSHEERGFEQTPFGRPISYAYAHQLKID